jgi:hypothetical protein
MADVTPVLNSWAFRRWVRETRKCAVCGQRFPDPDHVRPRGMGGRRDPADWDRDNVVPLCRDHHRMRHNVGIATFQQRMGVDLHELAVATWAIWESLTPQQREWYAKLREL